MNLQKANSNKRVKSSSKKDRISQLPDDVLCYIISFLPTTYDAIATTVLSSRFKNLWKNISHLTFDDTLPPSNCKRFVDNLELKNNVKFAKFVKKALRLHNPHSLENFSLQIYQNTKKYRVSRWVSRAIMKGIQSLNLSIDEAYPMVELPNSLFTCKTLEVLKLDGDSLLINVQPSYCLPKLRELELFRVEYQNEEAASKLISSCVSLESLFVQRKWLDNVDLFTIHSPTLRSLAVGTGFQYYEDDYEDKLEIDCPALQNLELDDSSDYYKPTLPRKVFDFESLEVLVLQHGSIIKDAVRSICLPNIRILKLINVNIEANTEVVNQIISSCSKSLESLRIHNITLLEDIHNKIVINSPALKILELTVDDRMSVDFDLERLSSLEEANIDIWRALQSSFRTGPNRRIAPNRTGFMTKLYQALQNVKTLTLRVCQERQEGTTKALGPWHAFPIFDRLTVLQLNCEWETLQEFINKSNNLEDLTFTRCACICELDKRGIYTMTPKNISELHKHGIGWRNPDNVPACLLSSLRRMSIHHFIGSRDDLAMVKYILRNAKVMLTMKIQFYDFFDKPKRKMLKKELLNFHRGLKNCKVLLSIKRGRH